MEKYGLLINYDYCTGCHTCEIACQQEHDYPVGKNGIKLTEYTYENHTKLCIDNLPFPTELCDLCLNRHQQGELPACVKHCQAQCMSFGQLSELVKQMETQSRTVLYSPK